ncbi:MAG: TatD family hydrolase [Candidatus Binatia bacterium]|nr:TatD family hydrolase [Candidatus Binatia bacterium]
MRFADSHCHLTDPQFDNDRDLVLERARSAGVARCIVIGATGDFSHNERAVALARQHPDLFAVVGVHPHDAKTITPETYIRLRELAHHPKVVGLGETGLDFYYDNSPRADQRRHFRAFIRLARELDLPLSLHVRDAYPEAIGILRAEGEGQVKGVMHCFTGTEEDAHALLELGLFISFSGIVTFKNAQALREVLRIVPLTRLLIETDCPLLAPVPYRGRRNEPAYVVRVAETIATVTNRPLAAIAEATLRNTEQLFRLPV